MITYGFTYAFMICILSVLVLSFIVNALLCYFLCNKGRGPHSATSTGTNTIVPECPNRFGDFREAPPNDGAEWVGNVLDVHITGPKSEVYHYQDGCENLKASRATRNGPRTLRPCEKCGTQSRKEQ